MYLQKSHVSSDEGVYKLGLVLLFRYGFCLSKSYLENPRKLLCDFWWSRLQIRVSVTVQVWFMPINKSLLISDEGVYKFGSFSVNICSQTRLFIIVWTQVFFIYFKSVIYGLACTAWWGYKQLFSWFLLSLIFVWSVHVDGSVRRTVWVIWVVQSEKKKLLCLRRRGHLTMVAAAVSPSVNSCADSPVGVCVLIRAHGV